MTLFLDDDQVLSLFFKRWGEQRAEWGEKPGDFGDEVGISSSATSSKFSSSPLPLRNLIQIRKRKHIQMIYLYLQT